MVKKIIVFDDVGQNFSPLFLNIQKITVKILPNITIRNLFKAKLALCNFLSHLGGVRIPTIWHVG